MGSYAVEDRGSSNKRFQKITKTWRGYLGSFVVSMVGGVMLCYWEFKFHPTNTQLWMVPLGLILFSTPVIVCFSVFFSELCISPMPMDVSSLKQPPPIRLHQSVIDFERHDDDDDQIVSRQ